MQVKLSNSQKKLELADDVFASEYNQPLIHQVVTAYMAAGRAGTKAQKTRAEVRGGGKKPWRQKGTGQARAGTSRGPIWRGGGVTFAADTRSYKQKVNKKMFRGAICSIFSELIRQDRLCIVDDFQIEAPKTKAMLKKLNELQVSGNTLIISDAVDESLYLSARNLQHVDVRDSITAMADPVALVRADKVIVTEAAIKEIEGLLQ
jgi:large subunit ribosomal protein L4